MAYREFIATEGNKLVILGEFAPCKRILCPEDVDIDIIECSKEDALELEALESELLPEFTVPINSDNVDEILEQFSDIPIPMNIENDLEIVEEVDKYDKAESLRKAALLQRAAFFLLDKGYEINDNITEIFHE